MHAASAADGINRAARQLVAFAENAPQIEGDRALLAFMPSLCRMLEGAPEPHITFRGVQGIATIMSCAEVRCIWPRRRRCGRSHSPPRAPMSQSNLLADVFGSTVPTVLSVLRRAPDVDRDDAGPGQGEEPDFRRACIDRERSIVADAVGSCPQSAALQERGSRVSMLACVALRPHEQSLFPRVTPPVTASGAVTRPCAGAGEWHC